MKKAVLVGIRPYLNGFIVASRYSTDKDLTLTGVYFKDEQSGEDLYLGVRAIKSKEALTEDISEKTQVLVEDTRRFLSGDKNGLFMSEDELIKLALDRILANDKLIFSISLEEEFKTFLDFTKEQKNKVQFVPELKEFLGEIQIDMARDFMAKIVVGDIG